MEEPIPTINEKVCPKCKRADALVLGSMKAGPIVNGELKGDKYMIYMCVNPKCQKQLFKIKED